MTDRNLMLLGNIIFAFNITYKTYFFEKTSNSTSHGHYNRAMLYKSVHKAKNPFQMLDSNHKCQQNITGNIGCLSTEFVPKELGPFLIHRIVKHVEKVAGYLGFLPPPTSAKIVRFVGIYESRIDNDLELLGNGTTVYNNYLTSTKTRSLEKLPEVIIVNIFKYIQLTDLLQNVSKTCKTFYNIIRQNSVLWKHFYFEEFNVVELSESQLQSILTHSVQFREFLIPETELKLEVPTIDLLFTNHFCNSKFLYWLDLTYCRLSTLGFLKCLTNLEILNLSNCVNLIDEDFLAVAHCTKLDQLHLSFTKVSPHSVLKLASKLKLISLDICGVDLTVAHCYGILERCYESIMFIHLTLAIGENEQEFEILQSYYRDCSIVKTFRTLN
ncbi:hypothetical protein KUTeg_004387 [Tegillarca granosa]|uniref:F-box domain-containing protein n=1 Tax=Tegillarca granosa TaxID=220873 RepID=A0ABQ9FPT9_TEGGR|nr:hypothetical protein KUTeg_004387 [Tegillarca granosa]